MIESTTTGHAGVGQLLQSALIRLAATSAPDDVQTAAGGELAAY